MRGEKRWSGKEILWSRIFCKRSSLRKVVAYRGSLDRAIALAEDDSRDFSASKDGIVMHWDVESGKSENYLWPSEDVLVSHNAKPLKNSAKKRSKNVLSLAVSSDGRLLASGRLDCHVHLWDTHPRQHLHAFHGHKGPVSCLTCRQGTPQLISRSFDRTIKSWNAEDRTHMDN